jgi:hypothetical protein
LLFGSACTVDVEESEPLEDDVAESDSMLHVAPSHDMDTPTDREAPLFDEAENFDDDDRSDQGPLVIPGTEVAEPEPDPWDDPMKSGSQNGGGSNKD